MNLLAGFFWNVIRKNKVTDAAWLYLKHKTLMPVVLNKIAPYPTGVEIEVTTVCNLRCRMCENRFWPASEKKLMSFDKFKHIVDQFPGLRWAGITGIGSCFCNPDIVKMFEYCHSKGVLIEYAESYAKLSHYQIEKIVEYCDHLTVSLDSSHRDVYNYFREGANFDTTIANIKYLLSLRKHGQPKVVFHLVVNKTNIGEVAEYPGFIASLNPGENAVVMFSRLLHNFPEISDIYMDIPAGLQEKVEAEGEKYGLPISWNCNIPVTKPTPNKCLEWGEPYILVDGNIIPDCSQNESNNRDYLRKTSLGNVFEKPFKEIWRGKRYEALRASLRRNRLGRPCNDCILYEEPR